MNKQIKNLLPKKIVLLIILVYLFFFFGGYYPTFTIPPVKKSEVYAQIQQKEEIISVSFSKPLILPHPGFLSTKFSAWHPGIDIATGLGMPIHSITDGEVSEVGRDIFGLGNFVVISHENEFKSTYAHLGKIYVKKGQKVSSDNTLGEVGLTGHTSGPHTHLEITRNGEYVNPQNLLPEITDPNFIGEKFLAKK